jgi:methanogenic corrinoid protein MtbC1
LVKRIINIASGENGMSEYSPAFYDALTSLDRPRVEELFHQAARNRAPIQVVEELMIPALIRLGQDWNTGDIALSQIYMGSRICEDVVEQVLPTASAHRKAGPTTAIVVLNDYHTLGKRIVLSVMHASGFDVLDYGRMEIDALIERVQADHVKFLLISVLMLPAALKVKELRAALDTIGRKVRIAVGGAPFLFDPELWREVGADAMGHNASDAITIVKRWQQDSPS